MKDKILIAASELFLNYGFKSVTMDDIAYEMGISKKTIYQHFENKTKLVEATAMHTFDFISLGIDQICELKKNPIEEIYDIKQFVMDHLKDEKSSPQYQLQKYYPKIYASLKTKQFEVMLDCVSENLNRGIELELYRKTMQIEFTARIYFAGVMSIKDNDIFSPQKFSKKIIMEYFLEYHLRGICTTKGLEKLNTIIDKNNVNK